MLLLLHAVIWHLGNMLQAAPQGSAGCGAGNGDKGSHGLGLLQSRSETEGSSCRHLRHKEFQDAGQIAKASVGYTLKV